MTLSTDPLARPRWMRLVFGLMAGTALACALAGCGGGGSAGNSGGNPGSGNPPAAEQPRLRCAP
ncbi:hypothetical protein [Paracidovorax wautersii]|uniref:hypothetical protein n=1 Tax=Paracidovorax wautersii TaxID=1177982 RepID=UPI0031D449B5